MASRKILFKADTSQAGLGKYKDVTRETNPELFRDLATSAQSIAEAKAAFERLIFKAVYGDDAVPAAPEDVDPDELSLSDSDSDSDYDEGTPAPDTDALDIDDPTWKVGIPKSQPLTYAIPTDNHGGKEWRQIKFHVDFSAAKDVDKANRARRQGLYRAGKALGLPLKRARTDDKPFTQENEDWVAVKYDVWAVEHGGKQMPIRDLYKEYIARFPQPERTQSSLTSYIYRKLKDKKDEYRP